MTPDTTPGTMPGCQAITPSPLPFTRRCLQPDTKVRPTATAVREALEGMLEWRSTIDKRLAERYAKHVALGEARAMAGL